MPVAECRNREWNGEASLAVIRGEQRTRLRVPPAEATRHFRPAPQILPKFYLRYVSIIAQELLPSNS